MVVKQTWLLEACMFKIVGLKIQSWSVLKRCCVGPRKIQLCSSSSNEGRHGILVKAQEGPALHRDGVLSMWELKETHVKEEKCKLQVKR